MENIKQIESMLFVSRQKLGDNTYMEIMRNLTGLYSHICQHKNLENGFECPHCMEEIEYEEIEND
tara:strand:- start:1487 stop:1681 length:195 start_codon:yes stop_codon:yes gene_type:complete